jgi:hypothetical protein
MRAGEKAFHRTGLACTGSPHAGMNLPEAILGQTGLSQGFAAGRQNRIPDEIGIKPEVRGTAGSFPQQNSLRIAQSGPALGAAAINAKEKGFGHCSRSRGSDLTERHNAT